MYNLNPDFTAEGTAVIEDSGDIPVNVGETVQGLNGIVVYKNIHYEREITVEFRSETSKNSFLNSISTDNTITYDGHTYFIKNSNLAEQFNRGIKGVWTYNLSLIRDNI